MSPATVVRADRSYLTSNQVRAYCRNCDEVRTFESVGPDTFRCTFCPSSSGLVNKVYIAHNKK